MLEKIYWKENIVLPPVYFVNSLGIGEATIRQYVEYQGKKNSGQLRMEL